MNRDREIRWLLLVIVLIVLSQLVVTVEVCMVQRKTAVEVSYLMEHRYDRGR